MPNKHESMKRQSDLQRLAIRARQHMSFNELAAGLGRALRRNVIVDENPQQFPHKDMKSRIKATAHEYDMAVSYRVSELFCRR